ncbi:unnamed protein product [Zymoseptoria tritici ST99CH_1E4]|uniref:Uncharacterized protein n=1 Tax=Zymoseptoria tritici ST99CH_1E4 TaxID=1276532 RepID=A0A2H1G4H6_ZYMTR|nr:unnamed protein product [Zymoseptoria tritici ST99CH_1E4]
MFPTRPANNAHWAEDWNKPFGFPDQNPANLTLAAQNLVVNCDSKIIRDAYLEEIYTLGLWKSLNEDTGRIKRDQAWAKILAEPSFRRHITKAGRFNHASDVDLQWKDYFDLWLNCVRHTWEKGWSSHTKAKNGTRRSATPMAASPRTPRGIKTELQSPSPLPMSTADRRRRLPAIKEEYISTHETVSASRHSKPASEEERISQCFRTQTASAEANRIGHGLRAIPLEELSFEVVWGAEHTICVGVRELMPEELAMVEDPIATLSLERLLAVLCHEVEGFDEARFKVVHPKHGGEAVGISTSQELCSAVAWAMEWGCRWNLRLYVVPLEDLPHGVKRKMRV